MQGQELKALRKAAGLSQDEAGEQLGLSRVSIGTMERGGPIAPTTEKLANEVLRHRLDVSFSPALGKWTVTLAGPSAPGSGPGRVHVVLSAFKAEAEALSFAERERASRYPLARILKLPGPIEGPSFTGHVDANGAENSASAAAAAAVGSVSPRRSSQ